MYINYAVTVGKEDTCTHMHQYLFLTQYSEIYLQGIYTSISKRSCPMSMYLKFLIMGYIGPCPDEISQITDMRLCSHQCPLRTGFTPLTKWNKESNPPAHC